MENESKNEHELPVEDVTAEGAAPEAAESSDAPQPEAAEVESPVEVAADSEEPAAEEAPAEEPKPARPKKERNRGPLELIEEEEEAPAEVGEMDWYILKVQSNREKSICANLWRRVKMAGLEPYFDQIMVPTEDIVEFKNGKKKITKRKLYPGYIVVHMAINDDTWFLVRETGGIGDFTGAAGRPTPMLAHEVERITKKAESEEAGEEPVKTNIRFKLGDHVRITEGTFENFEGDVEGIDETNGRVTVMINIFGRTTPVEMEHWQMEPV
ncbi:transcription termination/antitermination protein NusG [Blastopirellula sp. JC732]|uniref:Transcription termination/antitermination protein NusG n=1 Tax=Blastopirellula sediminis TaxID=2894196 RepID=A0A9X1ML82_9BACT|nr:transcription termination/antitermination protein NusG [Blastopirellula sediminis]MCC9607479.1 transcription termination/antitermination protein NusG [Blastopirellula sediminis]MCC9629228.1 transcription termination/antitermination protein NusG [Blastopirellula sediminis]